LKKKTECNCFAKGEVETDIGEKKEVQGGVECWVSSGMDKKKIRGNFLKSQSGGPKGMRVSVFLGVG